jgi:hypothetical protein
MRDGRIEDGTAVNGPNSTEAGALPVGGERIEDEFQ